jgi:hypothetical protein
MLYREAIVLQAGAPAGAAEGRNVHPVTLVTPGQQAFTGKYRTKKHDTHAPPAADLRIPGR